MIDVACLPKNKNIYSHLFHMMQELQELENEGMVVTIGERSYSVKVHLIGSYGDIPAVSELNHLTGHTSYFPCRFCTIRPFKVGHLGKASNQPNDLCRQRTIEDYKKGDVKHGIKKKSCFRKL